MRRPIRILAILLLIAGALNRANAQQPPRDAALAGLGHQAYQVVADHYVLNPTARFGKSGTALPADGAWTIGTTAPGACPNATESCVALFYRSTSFLMSCQWVVLLNGQGSDGTILEQNDEASRYFTRRLSTSDARDLIQTLERPAYPPKALSKYVQGTVTASVYVSASGTTEQVTVLDGPGLLREATVEALQRAIFKPYLIGSRSAPFQTTFRIRFDAGDKHSAPVVTGP